MRRTLLAMDAGHPGQMDALESHFNVLRPRKPDPERIIHDHRDDIQAITTFLTPVRRNLIEALPNLEMIAVGAVGTDHIDLAAARERSITVTNTPDVLTEDTADVAMLLILNVARRAVEGDAFVRAGMWRNGSLALGRSLSEKTVGIVGLGRIGRAVARRAAAFNMNVIYTGPRQKKDVHHSYYPELKEAAAACDFLILTCPGGPETENLVDYAVMEALGPSGFLINISRGTVVYESDLLVALKNKTIAGAGLDVYLHEPNVPEELLRMDNVVLTPHIGSATFETREKMGHIVVENLRAHFDGHKLLTPVGE